MNNDSAQPRSRVGVGLRMLRSLVLGAFLAGSITATVGAPMSALAASPTTVATSASSQAFQYSAQDRVAYLPDGSLLVGYWQSTSPAGAYINHVTNPNTTPVSTNVQFISGGDEVSIITSGSDIWIQVGSELDGLPKLEQVLHGTYSAGSFTWDNSGNPSIIPGALTTGRQDPSLAWNGTYLIATWWDDTMGGNSDNVFYNWTTVKSGASGWAVLAKSGKINSAIAIKSGTTGAATLAGVTSILYNSTAGVAPAIGDLFEVGSGSLNAEVAQVASVVGVASPFTVTFTAPLGKPHAMSELDTTSTVVTYNADGGTATPVQGDTFQIGTGNNCPCNAELRQILTVTGSAPYVLTVAPLANPHAAGESIRIEAKEFTSTGTNSVQVALRHSTKLGATIAVYGTRCQIWYRTLLDTTNLTTGSWSAESLVDSGNDDCEGNFGGPTIAVDESSGRIHVFKAVTNSNSPDWSGITYWNGTLSGSTVSWSSRLIIDATGITATDPPDITGAVDSTGKVYVFWATAVSGGAIKFVTLASPYTTPSAISTVATTGANPRFPHVPAQAPLSGGYVPLFYQSGTGPYNIMLETRYPDTVPPTVPTGLAGSTAIKSQVTLTWTASTDNFGVTGYTIYRGGAMLATVTGNPPLTTYADKAVNDLTNYTYAIDAFDAAGNHSAQTASINVSTPDWTPPTVPGNFTATFSQTKIEVDLAWTASTDNVGVTGYTIYRNSVALTTVAAGTLAYVDKAITMPGSYTYALDAYDAAGNHSAQTAPITVGTADTTPPTVPTGLAGSTATKSQVTLTWSASTDNVGVTGYTIYRGGVSLATVSGSTLTYADKTVTDITNYVYSVDAFDAAGNHSAQSTPINVNTPDWTPPTVPSTLTATFNQIGPEVDLAWTGSTDNVGVTGYTIYRNGTMLTTVSGGTLTYVDKAITIPANYTYTVDAFDAAGNHSAQSAPASVGTVDTIPPTVPTGFNAALNSAHGVDLSWSASTDNVGVTGYRIWRNGAVLTTVSGTTLAYTDNSVGGRTTYTYTVDAFDAAGNHSAQSASSTVTTGVSAPCQMPNVTATPASSTVAGSQVTISATSSGCPNPTFEFWMLAPGGSWTVVQVYSAAGTFTWNTTPPTGTYYYSVWVRDASSLGSYDNYLPGTAYMLTTTACSSVNATASPASPQVTGTAVTITATAAPGCSNPRFQFWIQPPGGGWSVAQAYSSSNTYNWNTTGTAGTYHYSVWVRDASSLSSYDAYYPGTAYVLTSTSCNSVSASASPGSPQLAGTVIAISAASAGCPNPRYQFWILAPGGSWSVAQAYSTSASYSWNTTGLPAGSYHFSVWVRDAGSGGSYDAYFPGTLFTLSSNACTGVSASASPASGQPSGTSVTITAAATGCPNAQYEFWIQAPGGAWTMVRAYSSSATFTWNTTGLPPGTYRYSVWVRDASSSGSYDAYWPGTAYTLT